MTRDEAEVCIGISRKAWKAAYRLLLTRHSFWVTSLSTAWKRTATSSSAVVAATHEGATLPVVLGCDRKLMRTS